MEGIRSYTSFGFHFDVRRDFPNPMVPFKCLSVFLSLHAFFCRCTFANCWFRLFDLQDFILLWFSIITEFSPFPGSMVQTVDVRCSPWYLRTAYGGKTPYLTGELESSFLFVIRNTRSGNESKIRAWVLPHVIGRLMLSIIHESLPARFKYTQSLLMATLSHFDFVPHFLERFPHAIYYEFTINICWRNNVDWDITITIIHFQHQYKHFEH